ncbi:unnamed protein product [Adineta steineri]|uniref:Uncharacterized protein n=1 Tax=Adineta steineri TaxID=433720 RepID=A0A819MI08_9BILA|nr:unnamed protein product [Adineta steineri]CAF1468622.1 unnamed protein product [Adineta steineri]CAF3865273.1 unnamed protein product [Adineta steineri]CAF3979918.1 unnamed protein product [Adineta steineri]
MPLRRNTFQQSCNRPQPPRQTIEISKNPYSSKIEFSIISDGPVDTTIAIDSSLLITKSFSPSAPSQRNTFSLSGWNSPVKSTVPDLAPPPLPLSTDMVHSKP